MSTKGTAAMLDGGSESAAAAAIGRALDEFWDSMLESEPLVATELGDRRFDHLLPDLSQVGRDRRLAACARFAAAMSPLRAQALPADLRISVALADHLARRQADRVHCRLDLLEAASHQWGPGHLLAEVTDVHTVISADDAAALIARLQAIPGYLRAACELLAEGARSGITAADAVAARSIRQVERILAAGVDHSPLVAGLAKKDPALADRAAVILAAHVLPGYRRYADALTGHRPAAAAGFGLGRLPDGDRMYRAAVRAWTSLDLDPQQVHEQGRVLLAAAREERAALGAVAAPTLAPGGEIERLARGYVLRAHEVVPDWFDVEAPPCEVRPIDGYRGPADMSPGYYHPPAADGSRSGTFHVNTGNTRVIGRLAAVAFHETLPGHHLQFAAEQAYYQRNARLPAIRRFGGVFAGSAASEGWGLYAERLADDMGLYHEPWERAGMIDAQAWRAARLVVDTGIHALGWERDRAVDELIAAGLDRESAEVEADRYAALPGQALAYGIGAARIHQWRDRFVRESAGRASARCFHGRVLELGALPLEVIESELFAGRIMRG